MAARLHDWGKAHAAFQAKIDPEMLEASEVQQRLGNQPAAKAPEDAWRRDKPKPGDNADKRRPGFRHELASALALMEYLRRVRPEHPAFRRPEGLAKPENGPPEQPLPYNDALAVDLQDLSADDFDLLVFLMASHHGKVRMSLRSSPDDRQENVRQARGVRDGDLLPSCRVPTGNGGPGEGLLLPAVTLNLAPMELGLSERYGPSWRERTQLLLERYGPFRLAYLEALLRAADCRASAEEEQGNVAKRRGS